MPRAQCWKYVCVTSYNDVDSPPKFESPVSYLVYQRESGSEANREHWQIYAEATKGLSITAWQDALGCASAHVELRKGTQQEAVDYCKKVDTRIADPIEFGVLAVCRGDNKRKMDLMYSEAIASSTSAGDFISKIMDGDAKGGVKAFNNVKAFADYKWPKAKFDVYVKPSWCTGAWVLPTALSDWVNTESIKTDRPKCLVLVGPSRLGKTQWARSLGTHMYWRGMTNVTDWNVEAKYIIFDDIAWDFIPQKKSLLTCMGAATVTDKYKGKKDIIVDKPAIVLVNDFDIESIADWESYWQYNCCVVRISEPLFSKTQLALAL